MISAALFGVQAVDDVEDKIGPFSTIELSEMGGATAVAFPYAAHLSSWKTASGKEWIFISEKAKFQQGAAIRGGVPIIFPQFNEFGGGPRHGFARNRCWTLVDVATDSSECTFSLESDDTTLAFWPHTFAAKFHVKLVGDKLEMTLSVDNTGDEAFTFTCALHTYFAVSDFSKSCIEGLQGQSYWDNDGSPFSQRKTQDSSVLFFSGPIDRVYFSSAKPLVLVDGLDRLSISSVGFKDVVVWNPGSEAAIDMDDFADQEYSSMICVEAAVIDTPIKLNPGERWFGSQILESH